MPSHLTTCVVLLPPTFCFLPLAKHLQAFVIPGLLGLGLTAGKHLVGGKLPSGAIPGTPLLQGNSLQRLMAVCVLVVGVALFGNGIVQRVVA
jgi:hypothetical protein